MGETRKTRWENVTRRGIRYTLWCLNNTINFVNLFSGSLSRHRLLAGRKTIQPYCVFPIRVRGGKHITNNHSIRDELSLREHKPEVFYPLLSPKYVLQIRYSCRSLENLNFPVTGTRTMTDLDYRYLLLTRLEKSIYRLNTVLDNGKQSTTFYTIKKNNSNQT